VHIAGSSSKQLTRTKRKRRKRRSAIEPKIGHAKSESRLGRCYLKGLTGDAINVVLAAAGANFRKLLRLLPRAVRTWLLRTLCTTTLRRPIAGPANSSVSAAVMPVM